MSVFAGPNTISNGLLLDLDAANQKSYPGSGTTWSDLSFGKNNGTLTNGPTYSSANGGSIVFDGLNDYAKLPNGSALAWTPLGSVGTSTISIEIWFKTSDAESLYSKPWNSSGGYNIDIRANQFSVGPIHQNYTNVKTIVYSSSKVDGNYHQLVVWANSTNIGYSIDGNSLVGSVAHGFTSDTPDTNVNAINQNIGGAIMTTYPYGEGWAGNAGMSASGNIYIFKVYNKVLSSEEIARNFQAHRGRFGI